MIWTLRSRLPPTDLRTYLIFLSDEGLLWVRITTEEPPDNGSHGHRGDMYLKRRWERELPAFLAKLDRLRLEAATR